MAQENIDWKALEDVRGGQRIFDALKLALRRVPLKEIAKEVPLSSLKSIRKSGAYAHRLK
jgi:hypothetical protein